MEVETRSPPHIHNRLMLLPIIIIVVGTYKVAIAATAEFMNEFAMDCLYVPSHLKKILELLLHI